MDKLNIYLADGTFHGEITMSSPTSNFTAVRVRRRDMNEYQEELLKKGVYFLLIGTDTVYVGETGDKIFNRAVAPHSHEIDASWHTLVAFAYVGAAISNNMLQYIENAMCEFVYANYPHCATTIPARENCNNAYRRRNYGLGSNSIQTCNAYIDDIMFYIKHMGKSIFMPQEPRLEMQPAISEMPSDPLPERHTDDDHKALFYFRNKARDTDGKAEILILQGHSQKRTAILKAGSKVSANVLTAFKSSERVIRQRNQYEAEGKLVQRILQVDIPFPSQSNAGEFLNGSSFDGNSNWRRVSDNVKLKELL